MFKTFFPQKPFFILIVKGQKQIRTNKEHYQLILAYQTFRVKRIILELIKNPFLFLQDGQ